MLASEQKIFLNFPYETEERVLHPARIIKTGDPTYTAELDEPDLPFVPGQNVLVYFDHCRKFMKQAARIDAVLQTEPKVVIGFQTVGEAEAAEGREWYRVSTALADLDVGFGAETACRLLDVSSAGLAVESTRRHAIGDVVPITLHFEGKQYTGRGRVQCIRELGPNRFRYGIRSLPDKKTGGDLNKGQQIIGAAIEREQLRRLARSG